MAVPRYLHGGTISVLDELKRWSKVEPIDTADTVAKLTAIARYGMGQIRLFSIDTYNPPEDLFCRQRNGWVCFYIAKPLPAGDADVVALMCNHFAPGTLIWLEQEISHRRNVFGV
jgi:hypothetical protein